MEEWREVGNADHQRACGHPGLVDLGFLDELLSLDTNRGLKGFFDAHRDQVSRVDVDSNYIARDMDTWDDYRALHQEVFGVSPRELAVEERE